MFWLFLLFSARRTRELHRACFVCFLSLASAPQSVKLSQPCHFLTWKCCFSCDRMINAFLLDPCYHKDTLVTMRILFHVLPQCEVSMLLVRKCTHHILGEALNPSTDIRVIFSDWWLKVYPSAAAYKPSGLITWTFPVPKVVLSILVPLAFGSTESIKTFCKGMTLLFNVFSLRCVVA